MSPELTAGLFTLAGAAVGFTAAIVAEIVRDSGSRRRELADRRCRHQVETLTRIQEVAKRIYVNHRRDCARFASDRSGLANSAPTETIEHMTQQVEDVSELEMLAYRVHHPLIQEMAMMLISSAAIPEGTPADEAERREERARLSYHAIEESSGYEINWLLGFRKSSERARRRSKALPYPEDMRPNREADDREAERSDKSG